MKQSTRLAAIAALGVLVSGCAGPPLPGPVTPALAGERDPKLMPAHELTTGGEGACDLDRAGESLVICVMPPHRIRAT
jgi:hypothetical protein